MSPSHRPEPADRSAAELAARLDARYRTPLLTYFRRRVRDCQDAEDLTQEVFLRILRRDDEAPLDNAEVYLFRIAGNLLRDRARRAGTQRAGGEHASLDALEDDFHDSGLLPRALVEDREPERVIMSQETLAEVLRALDELGGRTRDIFILFRLEKMKHRDIAALYGITPSAVEKHIAKAGARLSRLFGP